jgi:hypothetical protein
MRNFNLTTLSILIFLLCVSISFTFQPGIVLASNAQGSQNSDLSDFKKQLELMEETIKKQQEMINALKEKIESKETVAYASVSKIEENKIEQVIDDYLTKDNTREKMVKAGLSPNLEMGYNKGFYFKTLDDKFSAKLRNRMQYKYQYTDRDIGTDGSPEEDESTFDFRRIRTKISGNAYGKNVKYKIEWDSSTDDVDLRDAYVEFKHIPWANIWAGQGKVFSRQVLTSSASLQMIDRADTIDEFRFQNDERKRGVAVHSDKILDGKFDYSIGVYNPQARTTDNNINTMLYLARTSYYPFGPYESYKESDLEYTETFKAHIGGGIGFEQIGQNESDSDEDEVDQTQLLAEFGFKYKGLSLAGEYHYRKRKVLDPLETADLGTAVSAKESLHDQGFFVQGGYFIIPKKLEIAGRYELIDYDSQNPSFGTSGLLDNICSYTAGLNYFLHGRDHKIQINYKHWDVGLSGAYLGDGNENFFLTQYQICF